MAIFRLLDWGSTGWRILDWLGVPTMIGGGLAIFFAVWNWLPFPADLILALVCAALFIAVMLSIGCFIGFLHERMRPLTNENGNTFQKEFNDLTASRAELFPYYDEKYKQFTGRVTSLPSSLRDLLESTPVILPERKERIDQFVQRLKNTENVNVQTLVGFCEGFYPSDAAGASDDIADRYRMDNAKFWDAWYLNSIFRNTTTHKAVVNNAASNWEQIKLLYYLQVAQDAQKRKVSIAVKSGLYDLANRVAEIYENNGNEKWLVANISALKRLVN